MRVGIRTVGSGKVETLLFCEAMLVVERGLAWGPLGEV